MTCELSLRLETLLLAIQYAAKLIDQAAGDIQTTSNLATMVEVAASEAHRIITDRGAA